MKLMTLSWRKLNWMLVFALAAFAGALFWARSVDPLKREELRLRCSGGEIRGIAVLPKPVRPCPVVIYLHGLGDTLIGDGVLLRELAELGLVAIGLEYNQTNALAFDEQLRAVSTYLQQQSWARTNAVAWIGFSLGAQRTLSFVLKHPETQPQLLVRLSGGWVPELDGNPKGQEQGARVGGANLLQERESNGKLSPYIGSHLISCPLLLVHGDKDEVFPVQDTMRLADLLGANGVSVTRKILLNRGHTFDEDRALVMRQVAEYCRSLLAPNQPFNGLPERRTIPFWFCMLPALGWAGFCFDRWRRAKRDEKPEGTLVLLNKWEKGSSWLAAVLATWAAGESAVHLVTPQLPANERTIAVARRYLIAPKWIEDFDCLSTNAIWRGKPLKLLLDHVELAYYTRNELINWKVDEPIYREFVLSPLIGRTAEVELNRRRLLWESFYPRIRKESSPASAAEIVVQYLRERVTISPQLGYTPGIETAWKREITDEKGFEMIYVAALRSVGIGARLNASGQAEFWTGNEWTNAPRPIFASFP